MTVVKMPTAQARQSKIKTVVFAFFIITSIWTLLTAVWLNKDYQDSWVLEDIFIPLILTVICYILVVALSSDLMLITVATMIMTFVLFAAPALKYQFSYGSSNDVASHTSMIATISLTGEREFDSVYFTSSGFHSLPAILSMISNIGYGPFIKVFPALLGSLVPAASYMLLKRFSIDVTLAKMIIVLTGISMPQLFLLNGTFFIAPIFTIILLLVTLRDTDSPWVTRNRISLLILALLLAITIVFWHAATSLILSFILIVADFLKRLLRPNTLNRSQSRAVVGTFIFGTIVIVGVLTYWMYEADLVFYKFVENIRLAMEPDLTRDLVPGRLFQLTGLQQLQILLYWHSRDLIIMGLAGIGFILQFRLRDLSDPFARSLRSLSFFWLIMVLVIVAVFVISFGAQGYRRFLTYSLSLSPWLAGFALWMGTRNIPERIPQLTERTLQIVLLLLIIFMAGVQIFPFQPAMPNFSHPEDDDKDLPVFWFHKVNTIYQYEMLEFAINNMATNERFTADYISHRQARMFFGREQQKRITRFRDRLSPSYVLAHWPGYAGAYMERAEYRSKDVLMNWLDSPGVDLVYDNGGSFILRDSGSLVGFRFFDD